MRIITDIIKIETELQYRLNPRNRPDASGGFMPPINHMELADGTTISIQAGRYTYCDPRNNSGQWYSVECGYPSKRMELLMGYAEDSERPTETVYGYVPTSVVAQAIA